MRSFGGGKADLQQGGQWDDNMSAFGGSEKAGEWVQQPGSAYGAWGPPPGSHPGSWTGAPSAMPFNQGSDFSQQQQGQSLDICAAA